MWQKRITAASRGFFFEEPGDWRLVTDEWQGPGAVFSNQRPDISHFRYALRAARGKVKPDSNLPAVNRPDVASCWAAPTLTHAELWPSAFASLGPWPSNGPACRATA